MTLPASAGGTPWLGEVHDIAVVSEAGDAIVTLAVPFMTAGWQVDARSSHENQQQAIFFFGGALPALSRDDCGSQRWRRRKGRSASRVLKRLLGCARSDPALGDEVLQGPRLQRGLSSLPAA